jgi:hypothetical protein
LRSKLGRDCVADRGAGVLGILGKVHLERVYPP